MTIDELTKTATALGIKLTNANEGTEIYAAWADRVREAAAYFEDVHYLTVEGQFGAAIQAGLLGDAAIAEASRYAI